MGSIVRFMGGHIFFWKDDIRAEAMTQADIPRLHCMESGSDNTKGLLTQGPDETVGGWGRGLRGQHDSPLPQGQEKTLGKGFPVSIPPTGSGGNGALWSPWDPYHRGSYQKGKEVGLRVPHPLGPLYGHLSWPHPPWTATL